jgi:hypothetical protein
MIDYVIIRDKRQGLYKNKFCEHTNKTADCYEVVIFYKDSEYDRGRPLTDEIFMNEADALKYAKKK